MCRLDPAKVAVVSSGPYGRSVTVADDQILNAATIVSVGSDKGVSMTLNDAAQGWHPIAQWRTLLEALSRDSKIREVLLVGVRGSDDLDDD